MQVLWGIFLGDPRNFCNFLTGKGDIRYDVIMIWQTVIALIAFTCVSTGASAGQMYWVEKSLNTIQVPNQQGGYSTIQLPVQRQPITDDDYHGPYSELPKCRDTAGYRLPEEECEYMKKHGY